MTLDEKIEELDAQLDEIFADTQASNEQIMARHGATADELEAMRELHAAEFAQFRKKVHEMLRAFYETGSGHVH